MLIGALVLAALEMGSGWMSQEVDEATFVCGAVKCRMTWTGPETGWRLRSAKADGTFSDQGAVQKLASFMGEKAPSEDRAFVLEQKDGRKVCQASDGTRIAIETNGSFRVFSVSGKMVTEVLSVVSDGKSVRLSGRLLDAEAVYGGGERLDRLNQRGRKMDLWTCDGYNDSSATYLVIPFFVTTRGGGVFVNQYERLTADFGADEANVWSVTAPRADLNAYFFAKDTIQDAVSALAVLSGRPDVPEDWNAGPVVCRYAPDLMTLEEDSYLPVAKGFKLGHGVKKIVEGHLRTGVRPRAMILEAGSFYGLANPERVKTLGEIVRYLTKLDIKPMVYMSMGNPPIGECRFAVSARIETNGVVVASASQRIPWTLGSNKNPDIGSGRFQASSYMDITDPAMWDWYVNVFWKELVELGVRGAKIDFCEEMPDDGVSYGGMVVRYDWHDPSVFADSSVHHAYPTFFISKFYRAMSEMCRDKGGFMVLSRGGGIGSQRNPFLWAGDQVRSFEKLDDQLLAMLNAGMSGVPFMTYDMAGYHPSEGKKVKVGEKDGRPVLFRDGSPELLEREAAVFRRGLEFTAFAPCVQTHGDVHNVYEFPPETQLHYRKYMKLRNRISPYLAKLNRSAAEKGVPVVRPLVYRYQGDPNTWDVEDEFLIGDALLVAPILNGAATREVYLPKGDWAKVDGLEVPVYIDRSHADAACLTRLLKWGQGDD